MSILLADIDATCSSLGYFDGSRYFTEDDAIQSLKHLIWILRRDNEDSLEYRRYIGHKKVIQSDLLPMLITYCEDAELSDVLLRLLVNLTNPTLLLFRDDLPKDGAGRRIYLDMVEISHSYKEAFARSSAVWETLTTRLQKILEIDVGDRMEEQSLVLERILVLTRNVLQVPSNPQHEKRVDNDINVHDQVLWTLHDSGMLELLLFILSSEYENQFHLHALEITYLIFREQKVETLADASVQRTTAEKLADEQALLAARKIEKAKLHQRPPPARHSRFGGTYVFKNMKSVSDRDLICHQSLERVVQRDFNKDKKKVKANFRLARDEEIFQRQSAFCIRIFLREFCIEVLTSAFNNMIRQVRRVLERNQSSESGHDQSYLLWAMRFFLEFNRLNGFKLHLVSEALSSGSVHWVCNQIQNDSEMIQTDKKRKIKWNRRLQLGIQAYREMLHDLQAMELIEDPDTQALLGKLKNNMFYVVEYREIVLHLLLSYNENHFTRNYLRDLIDTVNVYLKMMEKFCQGSIVVQTKAKVNTKKKKVAKPKKPSKEEISAKLVEEWDTRIVSNLSVVLANDINNPEEEVSFPFDKASEATNDSELLSNCKKQLHHLLHEEDFERAVLLMRKSRDRWPDSECFGVQDAQPEDELMLMKEIYLTDVASENNDGGGDGFWENLENSESESEDEDNDDEEEVTAFKEVVMNFADIETRLLNPKVVRACTWCLQTWEKMNYREIKSAVTILHRIAVNRNVPVMLMQAQLFRVFQQVFNAPRDARYEELRRLGIFVVRSFVKLAPTHPKIYAELLFFKTGRQANEAANGYEDFGGGMESNQKAWSEEQEEELRRLYMQNQESPENDQDVIDWIVENLTEKSRSRRGVIKKLKELGLIFKAPTKKTNAAAVSKHLFMREEDEKLRELYDEHRTEADCLKRIMEVFDKKRSKKAIVKRMVQLGLIADESEILPAKKSRNRREEDRENERSSSESSAESDDNHYVSRTPKITQRKFNLNFKEANKLRLELEESLKNAIEWVVESLNEAAEDFEEVSDDLDDAIPIVPFNHEQREALENPQFKKLLESINFIEPTDAEGYWKIPANMTPDDLKKRAMLLNGESVEEDDEIENATANNRFVSEDEDSDGDLFSRLRQQREALIYNNSDNEAKSSQPRNKNEKIPKAKPEKIGKPNTKMIKNIFPKVVKNHREAVDWVASTLKDKAMNKSASALDELLLVPSDESHRLALDDENFRKILVAINLTPPDAVESFWKIPTALNEKELLKRVDLISVPEETSSDDESDQMIIKRKKKPRNHDNDEVNINTQELKQRLAELSDSSVDETSAQNKRNALESSDEGITARKSLKRDRSLSPNENEMNATNNQHKRIRRIADSSDDE